VARREQWNKNACVIDCHHFYVIFSESGNVTRLMENRALSHHQGRKMKHSLKLWIFVLCGGSLCLFMTACGDDNESDSGGTDGDTDVDSDGSSMTSLSRDVVPIMSSNCGFCHKRGSTPYPAAVANDVYWQTAADVTDRIGTLIIAGSSVTSPLISVLKQEASVGVGPTLMPPPSSSRPPMSADNIAVVATWIDEGANDN